MGQVSLDKYINDCKWEEDPTRYTPYLYELIKSNNIDEIINLENEKDREYMIYNITRYLPITEDLLVKYSNYFDWVYVTIFNRFSEDFIMRHQSKMSWIDISKSYDISIEFIFKNIDKIHLKFLGRNIYVRKYNLDFDSLKLLQKITR